MGKIHCPYCDRDIENPEIMEIPLLTTKQVDLLWQIKGLAYDLYGNSYDLYGNSYGHPFVQQFVKSLTESINDFLLNHGEDPIWHIKPPQY